MTDRYILRGRKPVPCPDLIAWGRWFQTDERVVARTEVGPLHVSTVFLGLDHSFGYGPPQLFETMIFDGGDDAYQERCSTWEQAEHQHRIAVALAIIQQEEAEALTQKVMEKR